MESFPQMLTLVKYLKDNGINWLSPVAGQTVKGWEDVIEVISPTQEFYNKGISKIKHSPKDVINEQHLQLKDSFRPLSKILNENIRIEDDPCLFLGNRNKQVTWINKISIVIRLLVEGKKYLFTGDTSIDALKSIPDYTNVLNNIYWLKVAHHGSRNNSSPELFELLKPVYADISGGAKYFDHEVEECLKIKKTKVRSTKDLGDLEFPY